MINGVINVYKEQGYTSHDVVAKLRGILKQKKIGHTGTLDPMAEGVLPVCLGKATKLCDMLTDKDKTYEGVLLLGVSTDTQDTSGTVLKESEILVTLEQIKQAIFSFVGDYDQIPPMYSALKVNGKKLYELARAGIEIERKSRRIQIHQLDILEISEDLSEVKMVISCSKGTYIRTLCHDIGEMLGCGGCMKQLKRTKVSRFLVQDSLTLAQIETLLSEEKLMEQVVRIEDMFAHFPKVIVAEEYTKLIHNGNKFTMDQCDIIVGQEVLQSSVRVYDYEDNFIGIFEYKEEEYLPVKMFI